MFLAAEIIVLNKCYKYHEFTEMQTDSIRDNFFGEIKQYGNSSSEILKPHGFAHKMGLANFRVLV